jgi:hypothetical protein
MPIIIRPSTCSVGELFSNGKTYCLPPFQRSYGWSEDQAYQLFDDLLTAYLEYGGGRHTEYFLGSIILKEDGPYSPLEVVDGQQRLLTLLTILAVIRDRLANERFRNELQTHIYRFPSNARGFDASPRLEVMAKDQDEFHAMVTAEGGTCSPIVATTASMTKLANVIRKLHAEFPDMRTESIEGFATFILNQCSVVVLSTESLETACKLFKSVNTPGLPLDDLAFARHELIFGQPQQVAWRIAEDWDYLYDQLGEDDLRSYFLAVAKLVKPDHDSSDLIQFIKSIRDNGTLLLSFRTKILNFVHNYHQLETADLDFRDDSNLINSYVKSLKAFDVKEWRTPALLWLSLGRNGAETAKFFSLLNALVLGLIVLHGRSSRKLCRRLDLVTDAINSGSVITSATSPIRFTTDEWDKIQAQIERPKGSFTKHLLVRLNAKLSHDELRAVFLSKVEIEHILPQKPRPDSGWTQLFDETQREHYTHLLGNLTILNKKANAGASNRDFSYKKSRIFGIDNNQCFALTSYVNNLEVWDARQIEARHQVLMGHARQLLRPH